MCNNCKCEKELEAKITGAEVDLALLKPVFAEYAGQKENIISILQKTQDIGYLPLAVLQEIAAKTGNKRARIYGIATFYSQFMLESVRKYVILQYQGTTCHVNCSREVGRAICEYLRIKPGETTADGLFTLEDVACLGCCSLAPVIMINGEVYDKLTPENVSKILAEIKLKEKDGACN